MPLDVGGPTTSALDKHNARMAAWRAKVGAEVEAKAKKLLPDISVTDFTAIKDSIDPGSKEGRAVKAQIEREIIKAEADAAKVAAFTAKVNAWIAAGSPADEVVDLNEMGMALTESE